MFLDKNGVTINLVSVGCGCISRMQITKGHTF